MSPEKTSKHYETKDARVDIITRFGIALAIVVTIACIAVFGLYSFFKKNIEKDHPVPKYLGKNERLIPQTQLEVHPSHLYKTFRMEEEEKLHSYGWINKEKGLVRIPVAEAMERYLLQRKKTSQEGTA